MSKKWWKQAVVYQIYPKSFQDTNGDGVGDLPGIIKHLNHIKSLGVDVIWLNPIFKSPHIDNGYDISDYQSINPDFGTMDDFKELLHETHKRGMKIILDMVLNHTSDEHKWFQEACKSKDNPYRNFYIWRPAGKNGKEPNNWGNYFYEGRGSAWEWDLKTEEYYLHLYSKKMPDLNWDCPEMREEIYKMLRWWCDMGIDGFRLDAINRLKKPENLPDSARPTAPPVNSYGYIVDREICANQPGIHALLQELNRQVFSHYNIMTVGETGNLSSEIALEYVGEERKEIDMVFHFEIAKNANLVTVPQYKNIQKNWANVIKQGGWGTQYLTNHDSPRQISRFGDDKMYRVESGKMLAMLTHTQPGTVYIYQGEEIGMINVDFPSIDCYDDRYTVGKYYTMIQNGEDPKIALDSLKMMSRDNVRTPMQWNTSKYAGFSEVNPWMALNSTYLQINVEKSKTDKNSIYHMYKKLIAMRHQNSVMVYGDYQPVMEEYENVIAYIREYEGVKWFMIFNPQPNSQKVKYPEGLEPKDMQLLLSNYDEPSSTILKPYEGCIYRL